MLGGRSVQVVGLFGVQSILATFWTTHPWDSRVPGLKLKIRTDMSQSHNRELDRDNELDYDRFQLIGSACVANCQVAKVIVY